MFAVRPYHAVGKSVGLVAHQLRIDIAQASEISERKSRQSPIKRIRGNSVYTQCAGDVIVEGVEILCARSTAIEIEAQTIGQFSDAANICNRNIEAANVGAAAHAGKRIGKRRACPMIVKAKSKVVTRSSPASASTTPAPTRGCGAEAVIDANIQIVAFTVGRCHKMKILKISRCWSEVRQWDICQQTSRSRIDLRNRVVKKMSIGGRIVNLHRLPGLQPCS